MAACVRCTPSRRWPASATWRGSARRRARGACDCCTAGLWTSAGGAAFHVFGLAGLALSLVVCVAVLAAHDVALWALPVIAGTAVATFLALAMAVKVLTGRESLIYYHHEILLLTCGAAAAAAGLPVAASLDAAVLGIGAFLASGGSAA